MLKMECHYELTINGLEIVDENEKRNQALIKAKTFLKTLGITNIKLELLKNENGTYCQGSTRNPIIITDNNMTFGIEKFIIKEYDRYDKKIEQEIIKKVQNIIAPKAYKLNNEFIIEEYIDHKKYSSLFDRFFQIDTELDQNKNIEEYNNKLEEMASEAIRIHAKLAKMDIMYNHDHFLDEFRKNDERTIITDFGTSKEFYKLEDFEKYKRIKKFIKEIYDSEDKLIKQGIEFESWRDWDYPIRKELIYTLYDLEKIFDSHEKEKIDNEQEIKCLHFIKIFEQSLDVLKYFYVKTGANVRSGTNAINGDYTGWHSISPRYLINKQANTLKKVFLEELNLENELNNFTEKGIEKYLSKY